MNTIENKIKEIALNFKIKLTFIHKNDKETYYNRCSSSAGSIKQSPEIIIGYYENNDEKIISFFHEFSHLVYNSYKNEKRGNYSIYEIEDKCWKMAFKFLCKYTDLEPNETMYKYANETLKTYKDNQDNHERYAKVIPLEICMTENEHNCPYCDSNNLTIFSSLLKSKVIVSQLYCKDCHRLFYVTKELN